MPQNHSHHSNSKSKSNDRPRPALSTSTYVSDDTNGQEYESGNKKNASTKNSSYSQLEISESTASNVLEDATQICASEKDSSEIQSTSSFFASEQGQHRPDPNGQYSKFNGNQISHNNATLPDETAKKSLNGGGNDMLCDSSANIEERQTAGNDPINNQNCHQMKAKNSADGEDLMSMMQSCSNSRKQTTDSNNGSSKSEEGETTLVNDCSESTVEIFMEEEEDGENEKSQGGSIDDDDSELFELAPEFLESENSAQCHDQKRGRSVNSRRNSTEVSPPTFKDTNGGETVESRTRWDQFLARSLVSDQIEAAMNHPGTTTELETANGADVETKTDSHSSGRSSSISEDVEELSIDFDEAETSEEVETQINHAQGQGAGQPLDAIGEEIVMEPRDPDIDMEMDMEPDYQDMEVQLPLEENSPGNPLLECSLQEDNHAEAEASGFPLVLGMDDEGVYLGCQDLPDNSTEDDIPNVPVMSGDDVQLEENEASGFGDPNLPSTSGAFVQRSIKYSCGVPGCQSCRAQRDSNAITNILTGNRPFVQLRPCRAPDNCLNIAGPSGLRYSREILETMHTYPSRDRCYKKKSREHPENDMQDSKVHKSRASCSIDDEPGTEDAEPSTSAAGAAFHLWTNGEAMRLAPQQTGASSCGSVAVASVLKLFHWTADSGQLQFKHNDFNCEFQTPVRLRDHTAPLGRYLLSRSVAGTTHQDLIDSVENLTKGKAKGRFFRTYPPKRKIFYARFLRDWLQKGAIPILTMNLQRSFIRIPSPFNPWTFANPDMTDLCMLRDAWHHQTVYGADPGTGVVSLLNPVESVTEEFLERVLESERVLLIRASDVISRWDSTGRHNFDPILEESLRDSRWTQMNVIGQIIAIIRESNRATTHPGFRRTTHLAIPAAYEPGITLFALESSDTWQEICKAPELPFDEEHSANLDSEFQNELSRTSCSSNGQNDLSSLHTLSRPSTRSDDDVIIIDDGESQVEIDFANPEDELHESDNEGF